MSMGYRTTYVSWGRGKRTRINGGSILKWCTEMGEQAKLKQRQCICNIFTV